jgi:hypothetical protein
MQDLTTKLSNTLSGKADEEDDTEMPEKVKKDKKEKNKKKKGDGKSTKKAKDSGFLSALVCNSVAG